MDNDDELDKMMAGMSSSSDSDFSDDDEGTDGSPMSHTASAEKDFMRKLAEQRSSLSFSEGKDNSENEDSINFDNEAKELDFSATSKRLPTTTPSTSPVLQDSKYDDSDEESDGGGFSSIERHSDDAVSNMVLMKEDYNDYDDAGESTSEDEGVMGEFDDYSDDSDDSEFEYNIPVAQRVRVQQQRSSAQGEGGGSEAGGGGGGLTSPLQQERRQSFTSFNAGGNSFNPYINNGGAGYTAEAKSYDTQVTSFGFRGATSASIDRTTDYHLAHQAQATYEAGDYSLQKKKNKKEEEEAAKLKKKKAKAQAVTKMESRLAAEKKANEEADAEAKSSPISRAAESLMREGGERGARGVVREEEEEEEEEEEKEDGPSTPPRRKISYAEAKAPPPSPCTAPVREQDQRTVPEMSALNLGESTINQSPKKIADMKKFNKENATNIPARVPTMTDSTSGIYKPTTPRSHRIFHPIPKHAEMKKCYVVRSNNGVLGGKTYSMFEEPPGNGPPGGGVDSAKTAESRFMLNAKKKGGSKNSIYLITDDFDQPITVENTVGRLKGNWCGGSYTIYSGGVNPKKAPGKQASLRTEIGLVLYEYDRMGPGRMKVCCPFLTEQDGVRSLGFMDNIRQALGELADIEKLSSKSLPKELDGVLAICSNKRPRWDNNQKGHVLNFKGRVTESSVKNFQLECTKETGENTMLQFGRVSKNVFALDYGWPLNAVQAFGICLSSMDGKIADSKGFDLVKKYV